MPYPLEKFRGIFPAALTMFDKENNLDEELTARHWDWLIRQGVDGLVITGTSGEFIALENDERLRLFRLAREVNQNRVPLIYGTGHYSTKFSIQLSQAAEQLGAAAVIVILPYYQKPSQPAVIQHFRDVRAAIDIPLMLYNNPANSACVDLTPREVARLVEEDVLHMVKSTYETVVPVHDLQYLAGDRMAIFYGSFQAAFEALCAGAHGWISGILNVAPQAARRMYEAVALQNDAALGFRIWKRILPLVAGGYSRNPFYPLDTEQEARLRGLLEKSNWTEPARALENV
ncbi:MAG: dihydrodipicolinate synthase family protein [Acidobacteria bacterium]|nr:dihydrodipicolinate synthase family protein [Acidobacteriota bacterium]